MDIPYFVLVILIFLGIVRRKIKYCTTHAIDVFKSIIHVVRLREFHINGASTLGLINSSPRCALFWTACSCLRIGKWVFPSALWSRRLVLGQTMYPWYTPLGRIECVAARVSTLKQHGSRYRILPPSSGRGGRDVSNSQASNEALWSSRLR